MTHHLCCEPPTDNLDAVETGTRWVCPECGKVYERRPADEMPDFLLRLPGVDKPVPRWVEVITISAELFDELPAEDD